MTKTGESALKAARYVRTYCRMTPCSKCVFHIHKRGVGCTLHDPDHLPETWELKKIKGEQDV